MEERFPIGNPTQRLMLVRMLISLLIFRHSYMIISGRNIPFLRIWVSIVSRILWLPCSAINQVICNMLEKLIRTVYEQSLIFRYPNTLLIDTSLYSRDLVALIMRFITFYSTLDGFNRLDKTSITQKTSIKITRVHIISIFHLSDSDYALLYTAWKAYRSTCYRLFMEDDNTYIKV